MKKKSQKCIRDLVVIMLEDLYYDEHNNVTDASRWTLRPFKTSDAGIRTMFVNLVSSVLDYC